MDNDKEAYEVMVDVYDARTRHPILLNYPATVELNLRPDGYVIHAQNLELRCKVSFNNLLIDKIEHESSMKKLFTAPDGSIISYRIDLIVLGCAST